MSDPKLEDQFHDAMRDIARKAIAKGYFPHRFTQMVGAHGGLEAARRLLRADRAQSGLTRLWEMQMLDDSMEALVLAPRFKSRFTDEQRAIARERLESLGWKSRS